MNDKRSQFSIMNDIMNDIASHNSIPNTWAKLVQSSFAKNKLTMAFLAPSTVPSGSALWFA